MSLSWAKEETPWAEGAKGAGDGTGRETKGEAGGGGAGGGVAAAGDEPTGALDKGTTIGDGTTEPEGGVDGTSF